MNKKLLEILVCPVCKGDLVFEKKSNELHCSHDQLAFPIRDDIPVLLEVEARKLTDKQT